MKYRLKICLLLLWVTIKGQDIQYSQYYANPLYLNPALTGTGDNTRGIINFRDQWPTLSGKYVSYSASGDHYSPNINSGFGAFLLHDRIGSAKITSSSFGVSYSYNVAVNSDWNFRPGLQLGVVSKNTNFNTLTFNDQFSTNGFTGASSSENLSSSQIKNYIDISSGGLVYNDNFWLGTSFYHLNRPNQSLFSNGESKLPIKWSVHSGYKISLIPYDPYADRMGKLKEISITPTLMYKAQGLFDQFDLGTYLTYEPIMLGLWYRGVPLVKKQTKNSLNHDALVCMFGVKFNGFRIGYSYDIRISKLTQSGGAHELSLIYEFRKGNYIDKNQGRQPRARVPKSSRITPCPKM